MGVWFNGNKKEEGHRPFGATNQEEDTMAITTKRQAEQATTAELEMALNRLEARAARVGEWTKSMQRRAELLDAGCFFGSANDPDRADLRERSLILVKGHPTNPER
jgi:hypothetical protein